MNDLELLIYDINKLYSTYRRTVGLWDDEFEFNLTSLIIKLNELSAIMLTTNMNLVHYPPQVLPSPLMELSNNKTIIMYANMGHVNVLRIIIGGFEQILLIKQNFNKSINYLKMMQAKIIEDELTLTPVLFNALAYMQQYFVSNHINEIYCTRDNVFLFDISNLISHQDIVDEINEMRIDYKLVNSYINMMRNITKHNDVREYKESLAEFISYYESFASDDNFNIIARYEWTTYILTCYVYWGESLCNYYNNAKIILEKINGKV